VNPGATLGEGPVWDHRTAELAWVDILEGLVHRTDISTGATTTVPVGAPVGALALLGEQDYLLAIRNGFARLRGAEVGEVQAAFDAEGVRMNDGNVDPAGRFLAGSMGDGQSPVGSLYARDLDGSIRALFDAVTISNGIAWSADGTSMYYVDSALQAIDVMDYDLGSGTVSGRRRFVEISRRDGTPDGMTIDTEGCIWVALWDGGVVRRYSPDGARLDEVALPVGRVTSCAFGGPDLDRLFITTASVGLAQDVPGRNLAGALFVTDPGCRGFESQVVER
jgi:sugar lactone lactonase YvrE